MGVAVLPPRVPGLLPEAGHALGLEVDLVGLGEEEGDLEHLVLIQGLHQELHVVTHKEVELLHR